jgi:hypothetical protein
MNLIIVWIIKYEFNCIIVSYILLLFNIPIWNANLNSYQNPSFKRGNVEIHSTLVTLTLIATRENPWSLLGVMQLSVKIPPFCGAMHNHFLNLPRVYPKFWDVTVFSSWGMESSWGISSFVVVDGPPFGPRSRLNVVPHCQYTVSN